MREPLGTGLPREVRRFIGPTPHSMCQAARRPRLGFTLVEVVAVVVIVGILSGLGVGKSQRMAERARVARAIVELRAMSAELTLADSLPATLAGIGRSGMKDPWGRPYQYLPFPPPDGRGHRNHPAGARKDRFLVPINSRFDLYSAGADGKTKAPLTAAQSRDDVIVANDGGYIGRASGY